MALKDYPFVIDESKAGLVELLTKIVELRQDDIIQLNEQLDNEGYKQGFKRITLSTNEDYTAARSDFILDVDSTTAGKTVTLDDDPVDGQMHIIIKNDASNNLTISGNGNNINGSSTNTLTAQYEWRLVIFIGAAGEWRALG